MAKARKRPVKRPKPGIHEVVMCDSCGVRRPQFKSTNHAYAVCAVCKDELEERLDSVIIIDNGRTVALQDAGDSMYDACKPLKFMRLWKSKHRF